MRTEDLYYFLEIVNAKSLSAAAQNLYVSQQNLSRIIRALEEEFHIVLFYRHKNGMELTAEGMQFLEYANRILHIYDDMHTIKNNNVNRSSYTIALDKQLTRCYLNDILPLCKKLPDIQLSFQEKPSVLPIVEDIIAQKTDFALAVCSQNMLETLPLFKNNRNRAFVQQTITTTQMFLVAHKSFFREAHLPSPLLLDNLLNYPLVLECDNHLYSHLLKAFPHQNLNIFLRTDSILAQLDCINNQNAIGFIDGFTLSNYLKDYPDLRIIPTVDSNVDLLILYTAGWKNNPTLEVLMEDFYHTLLSRSAADRDLLKNYTYQP